MLDTNMVSFVLRGKSQAARARIRLISNDEVLCISAVTEGELLFDAAKKTPAARHRGLLEAFLVRVKVQPWGRQAAAVYGKLRFVQELKGRPLQPLDTQIAAHALSLGAVLVTHDKAFRQVSGLVGLEDWATDL